MNISRQQVYVLAALAVLGLLGLYLTKYVPDPGPLVMAMAIVGVVGVLMSGGGGGAVPGLRDAIRRASEGERVSAPEGASQDVERIFDELSSISEQRKRAVEEQ